MGKRWRMRDERRTKRKKREMKNFLQSLLIHTSHRQLQTFHSQILFLSPTYTHTLNIIQRPGKNEGKYRPAALLVLFWVLPTSTGCQKQTGRRKMLADHVVHLMLLPCCCCCCSVAAVLQCCCCCCCCRCTYCCCILRINFAIALNSCLGVSL